MGDQPLRGTLIRKQARADWEQLQVTPRDPYGRVCFPGIGILRVQLVIEPSFEEGFSWDIRVRDPEWRLFRSTIPRLNEHNVHEGIKLLGYEELGIESDILRAYFDKLRSLTLPIAPLFNGMGGLDGTSFQLALFGDPHAQVRFQWWSDPPPQWEPLIEIANEMIVRFLKLNPTGRDPLDF